MNSSSFSIGSFITFSPAAKLHFFPFPAQSYPQKLSPHTPRQRISPSLPHLPQDPAELIEQAGPDGVGDNFWDLAVEGLGDAACDAGEHIAVTAERDGQVDGGLRYGSAYFVPKPVRDVADENPLVREIRLSGTGNQNFGVCVFDFKQ